MSVSEQEASFALSSVRSRSSRDGSARDERSSLSEGISSLQFPHYVDTVRCGFTSSKEEGSSGKCVSSGRESSEVPVRD